MIALMDTHTFLWWITDHSKLSPRAVDIISDGDNDLLLSAASGWEIAIKARLGRLALPDVPERFIPEHLHMNAFRCLPIEMSHALHVYALPNHHRDPFDRMLVAQSQVEGCAILTSDLQIAKYNVETIW
jgi:PIN domain nuclease of toxin-antitoxin system